MMLRKDSLFALFLFSFLVPVAALGLGLTVPVPPFGPRAYLRSGSQSFVLTLLFCLPLSFWFLSQVDSKVRRCVLVCLCVWACVAASCGSSDLQGGKREGARLGQPTCREGRERASGWAD